MWLFEVYAGLSVKMPSSVEFRGSDLTIKWQQSSQGSIATEQEIAMQRNDARATEVSRETICKIAGELESPLAYGSRYDRATLVYRAGSLIEVKHFAQ